MNQYLKATIWASSICLVIPVAFLYIGYVEMLSPEWGTNDSGAVQGFAFISLATLSAFVCIGLAFPLIAKLLQPKFTTGKWVFINILAAWFISFLSSCVFWRYAGISSLSSITNHALGLSFFLTLLGLFFLVPAMLIWLRIAKITRHEVIKRTAHE